MSKRLFKCKDGRIKNVLLSSTPYDPADLSAGVTFTVLDLTERKKIEKQLYYQANLLENVSDAVISTDNEFRIVSWNQAAERLYGWRADEVTGKIFNEVAAVEYLDVDRVEALDTFRKEGAWQGEVIQHDKDGNAIYMRSSVTAILDQEGNAVGAVAVNRDITQQEIAERALKDSETKSKALLEALPDLVFRLSNDGEHLDFYAASENQLYLAPEDFLGKRVDELLPQEVGEKYQHNIREALETGQIQVFEYQLDFPEGRRFYESRIAASGENEVLAIVRNVTERVQTQENLHRRAEELAALQATILEITTPQNLPDLLQSIVERAIHLLDADSGGMYLCDPDRREVNCVVSYNTARDYTGTVLKYGEGAAGTVAQSSQPLIIDDYSSWPGRAAAFEEGQPFRAVCSVPMIWNGQVTGVIHVLRFSKDKTFTQENLELLTQFANHAAIAVENTRLIQQSKLELAERKQAEVALRESEERYRLLFENMPIGVYRSTPAGQILEANPAFAQMLGYSKVEELLPVNVLDMFENPDDRQQELSRLEEDDNVNHFEMQLRQPDGNVIWVRDTFRVVRDDDGKIRYFEGSLENITEQMQAAQTLNESRERLTTILDSLDADIYVSDMDTYEILFMNQHMRASFDGDLVGKVCWQSFRGDLGPCPHCTNSQLIDSSGQPDGVVTWEGQNPLTGNWYLNQDRAIEWVDGRIVRLQIATEITERIQAETGAAEREAQFRTLFESSPVGIGVTDQQGNLLILNNAMLSPADIAQRIFRRTAMSPPCITTLTSVRGVETLSERVLKDFQVQFKSKDGSPYDALLSLTPIQFKGQACIQAMVGITERVQAQEAERDQRTLAEALRDTAETLNRNLDYGAVLERILSIVGRVVPNDTATVILLEDGQLKIAGSHGYKERGLSAEKTLSALDLQEPGNLKQIFESREPVVIPDVSAYPHWKMLPGTEWLRSSVGAPLLIKDNVVGFLLLDSETPGFFTPLHAQRLQAFANQAALAIENARLYKETQQLAAFNESIVQSMTEGIVVENGDGAFNYANPAALKLLGFTSEELLGMHWTEVIPADQHAIVQAADERRLRGEADRYEVELVRKDGQRISAQVSGSARTDAEGHITGTMAVFSDITERKRAEEELRESQRQLATLMSSLPGMAYRCKNEPDWTMEFVSDGSHALTGYLPEEMVGNTRISYVEIIHPEDRQMVWDTVQAAVKDKRSYQITYRIITEGGDVKWVWEQGQGVFKGKKDLIALEGFIADITERYDAENALKESNRMIEGIINTIPTRVFWKDKNLVYLGCNEIFARDAGFTNQEEIIGKDDFQMGWHEQAEMYRKDDREVIESGSPKLLIEENQTTPDGNTLTLLTNKIPMRDSQGEISGILGTYLDITEYKS